jgi:hypothetical protein
MSILDRQFLTDIYVKPPTLLTHKMFINYLRQNSQNILLDTKRLFSHIEGSGSDKTFMGLYEHRDKYIIIEIRCGTCSGCLNKPNTDETFFTPFNISNADFYIVKII